MNGKQIFTGRLLAPLALTLFIGSSCTTLSSSTVSQPYPTPPPVIAPGQAMADGGGDRLSGPDPDKTPCDQRPCDADIFRTFDQVIGELDFYVAYSERLGIPLTGAENKKLIRAIDNWLGTRYRWGGCSKEGIDCSCLIKTIYETVYGIQLNRSSRDMFYEDLTPISPDDLREGDILTFKIRGNRISHVGLYLKDEKFLHASRTHGVTIDDLASPYFKKRFFAAGRVPETAGHSRRAGGARGAGRTPDIPLTSPAASLAFALKHTVFH